jgi:hypothetical protein
MSCVIFLGLAPIAYSFHIQALYSSRHIVMLLGVVIPLTVVLFLSIIFFSGSLIAWKTKKQITVSRLSVEAKLRAMALVPAEVTWLRWLLEDFDISVFMPTPLLSDSTWAISIAHDPINHKFTKHIGVDAYFT